MRKRDQKYIFCLIEREMRAGSSVDTLVEKICEEFDISLHKAEHAVAVWIDWGGMRMIRESVTADR